MKAIEQISGSVIKGMMMGRQIGFPTINVFTLENKIKQGVYACKVKTTLGDYKGALYYGPKTVFNVTEPVLEIHLLDFGDDLYGSKVIIDVLVKIREPINFEEVDEMKRQLKRDIEIVRNMDI